MLCPNCESENRDGAKFCDECGFPLTGAIAARAAEAAAAREDGPKEISEAVVEEVAEEASEQVVEGAAAQDAPAVFKPAVDEVAANGVQDSAIDELPAEAAPTDEVPEGSGVSDQDVPAAPADADVTMAIDADFAGIDQIEGEYGERIVGSDFEQPQVNWRDGNTMQMPRVEGDEAPRSRDFLASSTTKQRKGKKLVVGIVVAIVAIAAVVAFSTYQMELWGGKSVPDVRGMTEADATSVLEDSGFSVRAMQVKSDDTEGLVLVMDPAAGSRAGEGAEIVIHIATAREIPNIVGKQEADAKEAFEEAGYENVSYVKERSDEEEGKVLSVSPDVGTRAKSTVAVTVKVAEPFVVPDTSSLGLDDTIAAIKEAGLSYDIAYVDTQEYVDGSVIGTEPAAGTKVKGDTVVIIDVARARGAQLTQLTRDTLTPGYEVSLGGTNYIIESLGSVNYLGDDQVAFTATARPYTVFFGVYVEGGAQEVSGTVAWTADNQVASIS